MASIVKEITVIGPADGRFTVMTEQEKDLFQGLCKRYLSDNQFQNISDLQDLERIINLELLLLRYANWMSTETDYYGEQIDIKIIGTAIKDFSGELRQLKKQVGIDRISRQRETAESLTDYIEKLKERAGRFAIVRNRQYDTVLTLFNDLMALVTLHDNCFAFETMVITIDGTKRIGELAGTRQKVLTKSGPGKWVDAEFRSFGVQRLMKVTLTRNRSIKTVYATPGHRWPVDGGWTTTDSLMSGDQISSCWGTRKSVNLSPQGVQAGIVYGDGSRDKTQKSGSFVNLCGEKNEQLLKWFPLNSTARSNVGWTVRDLPRSFKDLPPLKESRSYLYSWLAGYFAADGTVSKDGKATLTSCDLESLERARDICYILSIPTLGISATERVSNLTGRPSTLYRLRFPKGALDKDFFLLQDHADRWTPRKRVVRDYVPDFMVVSVEETRRAEEVFCAVVPETETFTLADNLLTGNCTPEEQKAQHCTTEDLLRWIREEAIPEYQAIDQEFVENDQKLWISEM